MRSLSDLRSRISYEFVFPLLFVFIYSIFYIAYLNIPDTFLRDVIYRFGIVEVAAAIIRHMTPDIIFVIGNTLKSDHATLEVVRGCDGFGIIFLVVSAMLAFRAGIKRKMIGITLWLGLAFFLNTVRIVALYFLVSTSERWFTFSHTYVAPMTLLALGGVYFIGWSMPARKRLP